MKQNDALLKSLAELKDAHEKASKLIVDITMAAAQAAKGRDTRPSLKQLRRYKQAIAAAKLHASQAEMLLVDDALPRILADKAPKMRYLQ